MTTGGTVSGTIKYRDGELGAQIDSPVPELSTYALIGRGLAGITALRRLK